MHVIDSLERGGAERMLVDVANLSIAMGMDVSCCVTRDGLALADDLADAVALHVLRRRRRLSFKDLRRFGELVATSRVDVLHVHSRSTLSFVALARILRLVHAPVVFHDHFGPIARDKRVPLWFRLLGRRHVAHYVGVCTELGDWALKGGVEPSRISVLSNGLDLRRLAARPIGNQSAVGIHASAGATVAIVVGGLRPDKGLDVLVEAMGLLPGLGSSLNVMVVGKPQVPSYVEACRARARLLGIDHRITLLGERDDVPTLLPTADIAIVPSRSESGPLVLIEALHAGLPVVATRTGEIAEILAAGGLEGVVPPDDARALANALAQLLSLSADERRARGARGRSLAIDLFNLEDRMPAWHAVYLKAGGGLK